MPNAKGVDEAMAGSAPKSRDPTVDELAKIGACHPWPFRQ
jgi:hypothetical protein